jgi:ComF family protein
MLCDWWLALKNLFLPIFCKQCRRRLLTEENGFFCPTCWELSPRIERPFCIICGRPHTGVVGFGTQHNFPCARCREKPAKHRSVRRVFGAARYEGAIGEAIKLLKFYDKPRLAKPLGAVMAEFAAREMECEIYDIVAPVPLHRVRLRERGFNQSLLLAAEVAPALSRARIEQCLRRIRPTRVQSRMKTDSERWANVQGAFSVNGGSHLQGMVVLLIDDVVTSGGTVSECASVLLEAGARAVDVLAATLAVAPLPR